MCGVGAGSGVNAAEAVLAAGGGYEEYTTVAHFNR
jgi:hypothetical protein